MVVKENPDRKKKRKKRNAVCEPGGKWFFLKILVNSPVTMELVFKVNNKDNRTTLLKDRSCPSFGKSQKWHICGA